MTVKSKTDGVYDDAFKVLHVTKMRDAKEEENFEIMEDK